VPLKKESRGSEGWGLRGRLIATRKGAPEKDFRAANTRRENVKKKYKPVVGGERGRGGSDKKGQEDRSKKPVIRSLGERVEGMEKEVE